MAVCDFSVIFRPTPIPKLVFGYLSILLGTLSIFVAVLDIECKIPKLFLYLGKISYGLYLFHELFLWLVFSNLQNWPRMRVLADHKWFAIPLAFAATVATASLSYTFFEKPILAFKGRFEAIRTRPL
jgi:peptidoglycan/LPS O-acetylase OafA/YrhL